MVARTSTSGARWLVGVMGAVVISFLLATLASEHLEDAVADRAHDIVGNAMPSVEMLSAARGSLHDLEHDLDREGSGEVSPQLREHAEAARRDVDQQLASYIALPFFPGEALLYPQVPSRLHALDADRAAYEASHDPAQLRMVRGDFAALDHAMQRVVDFDAAQGERLGLDIERARGQSTGLVVLLDGLSVVLALGAVVLALRQLRRATRQRARENHERELREAMLAEQNEALGQFAGRVAHDVLSPLATAMLSLDIVRRSCESDRVASRALERGVSAVHRVHSLVDGLLAFAKASGHPEPGSTADVAPILTDLVDGLSLQAQEHRIALALAPVSAGAVACSRGVLTSIATNLLRNAIKYMGDSPERRIELRAIASPSATAWRFEVADTGPGIPLDQQQRIFEPYVQLARGGAGAGIGLGLATVDRLVRAHGGKVGVESEPGRGARFWFELPAACVEAPAEVRHGMIASAAI